MCKDIDLKFRTAEDGRSVEVTVTTDHYPEEVVLNYSVDNDSLTEQMVIQGITGFLQNILYERRIATDPEEKAKAEAADAAFLAAMQQGTPGNYL